MFFVVQPVDSGAAASAKKTGGSSDADALSARVAELEQQLAQSQAEVARLSKIEANLNDVVAARGKTVADLRLKLKEQQAQTKATGVKVAESLRPRPP